MELFSTNKLFKEEKYEEILALWQNDESRNRMTDWDKWYVLLSLNKQKRYQETLDAYKLLRAKRDESTETELSRILCAGRCTMPMSKPLTSGRGTAANCSNRWIISLLIPQTALIP